MVDGHAFGPRAVSRHISGAENAVAGPETLGRRPGFDDNAGELPAEQNAASRFGAAHPPEKSLAGIDADRANLDQHVRVTESRFRHLDELHGEIFDAMGLFVHKRLHSANLSVKVSRTAASGPPSC